MNPTDEEKSTGAEDEAVPEPEAASSETTASETETASAETAATETAVAEPAEAEADFKMSLDVSIENVGPCKKHVRVRVPKEDIHHYYLKAVGEMVDGAEVPGFRVGHVPQKLIQRRFRKDLYNQVKQQVLIDSLEQMSEDYELDPINEPDFGVEDLEIRGDRDFEYEFDVEVRPEFDLPDYEGIVIQRPVRDITDADVEDYLLDFLAQYGERAPRDGAAEKDDFVTISAEFFHDDKPLHALHDVTVQLKPVLRFQDAELEGFDEIMAGVTAGETREADLTVSLEAGNIEMRGETVHVQFAVQDVRRMELPELSKTFLQRIGMESEENLRGEVRSILERQTTYQQRQTAREQVLEKIINSADWDLPEDLVVRQVENALRREILEMQQAGFTTQQIRARENELRQRAISTTRQALKEHFVLDKIATQEDIEVTPSDIDMEIHLMALQRGESPRRVRARLQKSGMIENLEAQIFERKAIDVVLERAQYEDVEMETPDEDRVEAIAQSICGGATETNVAGTSATEGAEEVEEVEQ